MFRIFNLGKPRNCLNPGTKPVLNLFQTFPPKISQVSEPGCEPTLPVLPSFVLPPVSLGCVPKWRKLRRCTTDTWSPFCRLFKSSTLWHSPKGPRSSCAAAFSAASRAALTSGTWQEDVGSSHHRSSCAGWDFPLWLPNPSLNGWLRLHDRRIRWHCLRSYAAGFGAAG